jgi:hypothetical protein
MKELASRGLGKVAESGQGPGGLFSGDLLGLNQFLDQHDSGVATRLDDAINEQTPAQQNVCELNENLKFLLILFIT